MVIDDTYNASPDSMAAGLKVLSSYPAKGKKIAVLGDMKELGRDERIFHRQAGNLAAGENIQVLLVVGELGREIGAGAKEANAGFPVFPFDTNEAAASWLAANAAPGDVVYLKASNSMHLKEITSYLQEHLCSQM